MHDFLHSKRFKILVAILAVLLGFMIYAVSSGDIATAPSRLISIIVTPFQKLSSGISSSVADFLSQYTDSSKNYKENQELKNENAELQQKIVEFEKLKDEVEQLRVVAGVKESAEDYKGIGATVIARDATEQYHSFTIDKGSKHGVSERDPVVTQRGLVGIVTKVYPTSARVITILSPDCNVSAIELRTGETGVISGNIEYAEDGKCILSYLQRETGVEKSDIISTSGSSGIFPQGYVIGIVEDIKQKPDGKTAYAIIRPSEEITKINNLCVLTDFEGKGEGTVGAGDGGE